MLTAVYRRTTRNFRENVSYLFDDSSESQEKGAALIYLLCVAYSFRFNFVFGAAVAVVFLLHMCVRKGSSARVLIDIVGALMMVFLLVVDALPRLFS